MTNTTTTTVIDAALELHAAAYLTGSARWFDASASILHGACAALGRHRLTAERAMVDTRQAVAAMSPAIAAKAHDTAMLRAGYLLEAAADAAGDECLAEQARALIMDEWLASGRPAREWATVQTVADLAAYLAA